MAHTQNANETKQARAWAIRVAMVEAQAIVIECHAIATAIEAMDRECPRSWDNWQEVEDRATLARTMRRAAERRIVALTEELRAL
jgi:hypothetical protein